MSRLLHFLGQTSFYRIPFAMAIAAFWWSPFGLLITPHFVSAFGLTSLPAARFRRKLIAAHKRLRYDTRGMQAPGNVIDKTRSLVGFETSQPVNK